ncbi:MAG: phasin family protein [Acetobacteraceae bacterium]|nr:phasin family protein [Acetobacteraceae bacterium]
MNQVTKTAEAFSNAARDAATFGQDNLKAVAQSAQLYVQGAQDLGRQAFAFAEALNAQAIAGVKALAGAKSLREAAEVQARLVRSAFERAANEGPRLQQAALQVAERAVAPLAERAKAAVAQVSRPLAAA